MDRVLLEKKFEPRQIRQRDGSFGNKLDYLAGSTVIQRLNDSFDGAWSIHIVSHEITEAEAIVLVELTAEGISKAQFGGSALTRHKETGKLISLSDDIKAATTDAIKKAATLFGVGLYLYNKEERGTDQAGQRNSSAATSAPKPSNITGARLTTKQHQYILNLAKDSRLSKTELNNHCRATYGVMFNFVSRTAASSLIQTLQNGDALSGQNNAA